MKPWGADQNDGSGSSKDESALDKFEDAHLGKRYGLEPGFYEPGVSIGPFNPWPGVSIGPFNLVPGHAPPTPDPGCTVDKIGTNSMGVTLLETFPGSHVGPTPALSPSAPVDPSPTPIPVPPPDPGFEQSMRDESGSKA